MPGCDRFLLKTDDDYRKMGNPSRLNIVDEDLHLIGYVIGKGGRNIKRIQDDTRTTIKYNDRYWDHGDSYYDKKAYFQINCRHGCLECTYAAKIALTELLEDARKNSGLVARYPIKPPYIGTMGECGVFYNKHKNR
mgnify:FL=1